MPLLVNLRHLEEKNLELKGEIPSAELDMDNLDELIHVKQPLRYDLEVQMSENGILVTGTLATLLGCECARCLKPFQQPLELDKWACHIAMEGEEKATVTNDCVDLTPYMREDILLAFPQHPLCEAQCSGLKMPEIASPPSLPKPSPDAASEWSELDKLKF